MAIQDLSTAQEECRVCMVKCRQKVEGLGTLIEDAANYSAEALARSVNDR